MAEDLAVRVDHLDKIRRSLKAVGKDASREGQKAIKQAAEIVAKDARALAPRRTGRLAASIKAGTSGSRGVVRSPLPYANVHEYGGTVGKGHSRSRPGATRITGRHFVGRSLERNRDRVAEALADELDRVFARHGFR